MIMRIPNHEIENEAIKWVIDFEKAQGRAATDARGKGPTDIDSPPLKIEVKAFGQTGRGQDLWLEPPQFQEARTNPNFRLYVVENVGQGDRAQFTLRVVEGPLLAGMVKRAREKKHFELPLPTASYEAIPVRRLP